ncbi:hypothetical protein QUB67_10905 [Microcoleus sp. ARI1-A1]|uniref:hypothetical protein n=1 Tax=Microcoleus sp. ARI1-A5 TaxID=2818560 RepID=UPI002FD2C6C9
MGRNRVDECKFPHPDRAADFRSRQMSFHPIANCQRQPQLVWSSSQRAQTQLRRSDESC